MCFFVSASPKNSSRPLWACTSFASLPTTNPPQPGLNGLSTHPRTALPDPQTLRRNRASTDHRSSPTAPSRLHRPVPPPSLFPTPNSDSNCSSTKNFPNQNSLPACDPNPAAANCSPTSPPTSLPPLPPTTALHTDLSLQSLGGRGRGAVRRFATVSITGSEPAHVPVLSKIWRRRAPNAPPNCPPAPPPNRARTLPITRGSSPFGSTFGASRQKRCAVHQSLTCRDSPTATAS